MKVFCPLLLFASLAFGTDPTFNLNTVKATSNTPVSGSSNNVWLGTAFLEVTKGSPQVTDITLQIVEDDVDELNDITKIRAFYTTTNDVPTDTALQFGNVVNAFSGSTNGTAAFSGDAASNKDIFIHFYANIGTGIKHNGTMDLKISNLACGNCIPAPTSWPDSSTDYTPSSVTFSNPDNTSTFATAGYDLPDSMIADLVDEEATRDTVLDIKFDDIVAGDDGLPTIVNGIWFKKGAADSDNDWSAVIAGAKLYGTDLGSGQAGTITEDSILFTGSPVFSVPDNGTEYYYLSIWLKNTQLPANTDTTRLDFKLDKSYIEYGSNSSTIGSSSALESGDANKIVVNAYKLAFESGQPLSSVITADNFTVKLNAVDSNNNIDVDEVSACSLSKYSGTGILSATGLVQDLTAGDYTWNDVQFDTDGTFRITGRSDESLDSAVSLSITASESGAEDYTAWPWKAPITLNTTSDGAGVTGTETDFPILVRITGSMDNFWGTAENDGRDIRFAKSSDADVQFPYDKERWNNTDSLAEFWVLVDSVIGNSSTDYVTMYWGKAGVADSSSPEAVFDTANSFEAVWHMDDSTTSVIADATYNNIYGTKISADNPVQSDAYVGKGQDFSGDDEITSPNNTNLDFYNAEPITVSAWVKNDNVGAVGYGYVVTDRGNLINFGLRKRSANGQIEFQYESSGAKQESRTGGLLTDGVWCYLAVTYTFGDSSTIVHYANSGSVSSVWANGDGSAPTVGSDLIKIGHEGDPASGWWDGELDEIRISRAIRSADWLRLCYQNQQTTDNLVTVGTGVDVDAPILTLPAANGADDASVAVDFTLPNAAEENSVILTFTNTGGNTDDYSPHAIYFNSGFETAANHTASLTGGDLYDSGLMDSVLNDGTNDANTALVDSAVYTVKIQYEEAVAGIKYVENTGWTYDITPPDTVLSPFSPADGATGVAVNAPMVATFDETIAKGSGNIYVKITSDSSNFAAMTVNNAGISGWGTTALTINPVDNFGVSTGYFVNIDSAAVLDAAGNAYPGISDSTTWGFATAATAGVEDYNKDWPYYTPIVLNTTSSGAGVSGSETDFPVLVRLNSTDRRPSANFWTSEVDQDSGLDIRFSKYSDNSIHFPYERERWSVDASDSVAEFWVLVDSVQGNVSSAYITMHWGNEDSPGDSSNGAAVFDTSNNFAGVWHLDEAADSAMDATSNNLNADRVGNTDSADGQIGIGQYFDGTDDYFDAGSPTLGISTAITVSGWINVDAGEGTAGGCIASTGGGWSNDGFIIFEYSSQTRVELRNGATSLTEDNTQPSFGVWHYKAFTWSQSSEQTNVYHDGVSLGDSDPFAVTIPDPGAQNLRIGELGGETVPDMWGLLDEVRISSIKRSSDWIKLCYQNQQVTDSLVSFGTAGVQPSGETWGRIDLTGINGGAVTESAIYVGTNGKELKKLSLVDGSTTWSYSTGSDSCGMPTYFWNSTDGEYNLVFSAGNTVYGIEDDGETDLFTPIDLGSAAGTPYITPDGNYFVVTYVNTIKQWEIDGTPYATLAVAGLVESADIVLADDEVYYSSNDSICKTDGGDLTPLGCAPIRDTVLLPLLFNNDLLYATPKNDSIIPLNKNLSRGWGGSGLKLSGNNTGPAFIPHAGSDVYLATSYGIEKANSGGVTQFYNGASGTINSGPLISGTVTYFSDSDGKGYALNSSGTLISGWGSDRQISFSNANAGPWIAEDPSSAYELVIFGTDDGRLYAFPLE